jgi:hypothetical protein
MSEVYQPGHLCVLDPMLKLMSFMIVLYLWQVICAE